MLMWLCFFLQGQGLESVLYKYSFLCARFVQIDIRICVGFLLLESCTNRSLMSALDFSFLFFWVYSEFAFHVLWTMLDKQFFFARRINIFTASSIYLLSVNGSIRNPHNRLDLSKKKKNMLKALLYCVYIDMDEWLRPSTQRVAVAAKAYRASERGGGGFTSSSDENLTEFAIFSLLFQFMNKKFYAALWNSNLA